MILKRHYLQALITECIFPGPEGQTGRGEKSSGGKKSNFARKHWSRTLTEEICVATSGGISSTCPAQWSPMRWAVCLDMNRNPFWRFSIPKMKRNWDVLHKLHLHLSNKSGKLTVMTAMHCQRKSQSSIWEKSFLLL